MITNLLQKYIDLSTRGKLTRFKGKDYRVSEKSSSYPKYKSIAKLHNKIPPDEIWDWRSDNKSYFRTMIRVINESGGRYRGMRSAIEEAETIYPSSRCPELTFALAIKILCDRSSGSDAVYYRNRREVGVSLLYGVVHYRKLSTYHAFDLDGNQRRKLRLLLARPSTLRNKLYWYFYTIYGNGNRADWIDYSEVLSRNAEAEAIINEQLRIFNKQ